MSHLQIQSFSDTSNIVKNYINLHKNWFKQEYSNILKIETADFFNADRWQIIKDCIILLPKIQIKFCAWAIKVHDSETCHILTNDWNNRDLTLINDYLYKSHLKLLIEEVFKTNPAKVFFMELEQLPLLVAVYE